MPTLSEIQDRIVQQEQSASDNIRRGYLKELAEYTQRDTILYSTAFTGYRTDVPSALYSVGLDDLPGFMSALHGLKNENLDIILHSPGGSMEAADQIVQYLRAKYKDIRAIVPQNAMSAATMIACACNSIIMGKHSAIGPIDPQVTFPTETGLFRAPAQAILDEFEQAKLEIQTSPASIPLWLAKIQRYPHGFLNVCKTTVDLSKQKVEAWLSAYMFAGVEGGATKAASIADWLGNFNNHKTHGRPITASVAIEKELVVTLLENDQRLQDLVLSVHHATQVSFQRTQCVKLVESHLGKGVYTQVRVKT